tara:strand:+ start:337 stop:525 length:189 start_codon:yes stop_codon:yes gene_type:complete
MTLFRRFVGLSAQLTAKVEGAIERMQSKLTSFFVRIGYICKCRLSFAVQLEAGDGAKGAQET